MKLFPVGVCLDAKDAKSVLLLVEHSHIRRSKAALRIINALTLYACAHPENHAALGPGFHCASCGGAWVRGLPAQRGTP